MKSFLCLYFFRYSFHDLLASDWTIIKNVLSAISCSSAMPSLRGSGTRIIFSSADATPKETWMNRDETRPETLGSY